LKGFDLMEPRKSLSDILANGERDTIASAWNRTKAAEDFAPLPSGEYVAHVLSGELFTTPKSGTPGYKLAFGICEGEHTGRRLWHDLWLTPAAMPMTKRDLAKLEIVSLEQLEAPIPPGIRCKLKVTLRKDDDGTEYNRVRKLEVVGIDIPEPDAFAPAEAADTADGAPTAEATAGGPAAGAEGAEGAAADPADGATAAPTDSAEGDASFHVDKLEAEAEGGGA